MSDSAEGYNVPRGAAYFTSQQVVSYIAYFVFYVTLARLLTKTQIGQVSLLAATLAAFNTLTQLALPSTATRFISSSLGRGERNEAGAVAKTVLRASLAVAIPATVIAIVLSPSLATILPNTPDAATLLSTTFLAGLILDLTALYGACFLGVGLYSLTVYQNILYIPLSRGAGLFLVASGLGVLGIVAGWAIGALVTLIVSLYFWRNRLPASLPYPVRPLLSFSLPLFAATLINLGQQWGDIALLQAFLGELSTTGAYYIVVSSVGFLSVFWTPVASALYPALSAHHSADNAQAINDKLALAHRLTNLSVVPLSAALAAVSATALETAYGPTYAAETAPFAILTLTSIFTAQAAILTAAMQAVGKTHALLRISLAATIIDITAVSLTARLIGPSAGAIGRALLYAVTVVLSEKALRPAVRVSPFAGFRKATALAFGVGLPLLIVDQVLSIFLNASAVPRLAALLLVFAASFVGVARQTKIFKRSDFSLLKDALPRRLHPYLRTIEHLIIGKESGS